MQNEINVESELKMVSIRIPMYIVDKIQEVAHREFRDLSKQCRLIFESWYKAQESEIK